MLKIALSFTNLHYYRKFQIQKKLTNHVSINCIIVYVLFVYFRYTWDTPIKDILGGNFKLFDDVRTENINLRDLLGHKVGIPGFFEPLLVGFPENTTREEFVRYDSLLVCKYIKYVYLFSDIATIYGIRYNESVIFQGNSTRINSS